VECLTQRAQRARRTKMNLPLRSSRLRVFSAATPFQRAPFWNRSSIASPGRVTGKSQRLNCGRAVGGRRIQTQRRKERREEGVRRRRNNRSLQAIAFPPPAGLSLCVLRVLGVRLEVSTAGSRAESAPAYQPRVTPWESRPLTTLRRPERAQATGATPALAGRAVPLEAGFPGRCPGLMCSHAVGVETVQTPALLTPDVPQPKAAPGSRGSVAQVSNLLYRRLPVGRPYLLGRIGGLEIRDTADWKSALRLPAGETP